MTRMMLAPVLFVAASAHPRLGPSLAPPPAPAGWSHAPGSCLGPPGCQQDHCDCSSPPAQLTYEKCSPASCHSAALAACKANPKCTSFAFKVGSGGGYELYSLTNWSFVPNSDWEAYALDSPHKPPGYTPPPPPTPECVSVLPFPRPTRPHQTCPQSPQRSSARPTVSVPAEASAPRPRRFKF